MRAGVRIPDRGPRGRSAVAARADWSAIDALGIKRLTADSRQVRPGDTFVAYPGETRDGRDFIGQAIANGAASVLWESRDFSWNPAWRVGHVGVPDLRRSAGEIASHAYGYPSGRLWMIGVTGTNGKTTCSHWIAQSLTRAQRKCAVIGTLGRGFSGALAPAGTTTPEAVELHASLAELARQGAQAVAMEVSSHGLDQHRVAGVEFDVALLTNVTRDHLDYHGTMRAYRAAKARLFAWPTLKFAVLNLDDSFGTELAARRRPAGLKVLGYGFGRAAVSRNRRLPRVQGRNLRVGADGLSFDVSTPWGSASLESALVGRFNAANLLGSLATLLASDVRLGDCIAALQRVEAVPGRTERFGGGRQPLVVVDYAHSPDALEKVLLALRELMSSHRPRVTSHAARRHVTKRTAAPRLICVFGCGGERDRGKRPLMGGIVARRADYAIVTSDNPRGENPQAIIADIVRGMPRESYTTEPDRAAAIRLALGMARRGDIVLVAGKGHEAYQEVSGERRPFSDAAQVRAALREGSR